MIAGEIHFGNGNNAVATAQRRMMKLPRLEDDEASKTGGCRGGGGGGGVLSTPILEPSLKSEW